MMRVCPTCQREFDEAHRVCPSDKDVLLDRGTPHDLTGRVLCGRYHLGDLIGKGGMSLIFVAVDRETGRDVAVKILTSESVSTRQARRLRREAAILSEIGHPGIVHALDLADDERCGLFLVMELLRGPTLDVLRKAGKLTTVESVVDTVGSVATIIGAAHEKGVVHRDVTPYNVILHRMNDGQNVLKVFDFGIARFADRVSERVTQTGHFVGTPLYTAPEQFLGVEPSFEADVYSLGIVLFEALVGSPPIKADNIVDLLELHRNRTPSRVSELRTEVSDELDEVVATCLSKRPEKRFRSASELGAALRNIPRRRPPTTGKTRVVPKPANYPLEDAPSRLVGTLFEDRYWIEEWLGPGRFGARVYRGRHKLAGSSVSIRMWTVPSDVRRTQVLDIIDEESRVLGVNHPNLIPVTDLGCDNGVFYLVAPYLVSLSLRDFLYRYGAFPLAHAVQLIRPVVAAIGTLHQHRVVSGRLYTRNIRVARHGRQESLAVSPLAILPLRRIEQLLGGLRQSAADDSDKFLAPEQRLGQPAEPASDLYAITLILLEALRAPPSHLVATVEAPAGDQTGAPRAPCTPPAWEPDSEWKVFLDRALAEDPAQRFQTASEWLEAIPERA